MIDPRIAHTFPTGLLLRLLPGLPHTDLHDVRTEFARFIAARTRRGDGDFTTWQDAWNTWVARGHIVYQPARCHDCHGRGFTHRHPARNLSRSGNPYICAECRGTGRSGPRRQRALPAWAPLP